MCRVASSFFYFSFNFSDNFLPGFKSLALQFWNLLPCSPMQKTSLCTGFHVKAAFSPFVLPHALIHGNGANVRQPSRYSFPAKRVLLCLFFASTLQIQDSPRLVQMDLRPQRTRLHFSQLSHVWHNCQASQLGLISRTRLYQVWSDPPQLKIQTQPEAVLPDILSDNNRHRCRFDQLEGWKFWLRYRAHPNSDLRSVFFTVFVEGRSTNKVSPFIHPIRNCTSVNSIMHFKESNMRVNMEYGILRMKSILRNFLIWNKVSCLVCNTLTNFQGLKMHVEWRMMKNMI